ncbi:MAG: hypothetical protein JWM78_2644 [Verrucomicrobiaceae bacterium]|nr:hypothetical protein [Verrucomicrobiaceae bacterium]
MRILITNYTLATRSGTETYVRDLALGLLAKGHSPILYSPLGGPLADELRALTIPVVDDLSKISGSVDLIHGQHRHETMTALLHFPGVPAIFFVHDWHAWQDIPPLFPRILRYVAVDETRKDRLILENGISESIVRVLPNGVDIERFQPRPPLPEQPVRGLVFSNYIKNQTQLNVLKQACTKTGIALEVIGAGVKRTEPEPELILPRYDLVFAMGRSALEAMAVGSGVVIWGLEGLGEFVTTDNFARLQQNNFGRRALRPTNVTELETAIRDFDAHEARAVQQHVRTTLNQASLVERHLDLYREVIKEAASCVWNPTQELRAAAHYMKCCVPEQQQDARLTKESRRHERQTNRLMDIGWISLALLVVGFGVRVETLAISMHNFGLAISTVPICLLMGLAIYLMRTHLRGGSPST